MSVSVKQKIAGHPFFYDKVRPLIVGGIDLSPLYRALQAKDEDVILDVGCGTGIALDYLKGFREYYGYDVDANAIQKAIQRPGADRPQVHFYPQAVTKEDVNRIKPTKVLLSGLLHHLDDSEALALLEMCRDSPTVSRIVTNDVAFIGGKTVSNFLARLDRGKFVRTRDGFRDLATRAGLHIAADETFRSSPDRGKALYFMMLLTPTPEPVDV